ncbi:glycine betaine/L-proline transporter ProP [Gilliamella sp. B2865]|uniref:glycine betaine/L-proline transporter ProP n=1 Tax=unclassified Gilliamella TaxID=2685620 RepID=UPI002269B251|nr:MULTISPECIES: glycine betaine/L-proline transporter ProP [unclassified Gilliamella]MCX8671035.1 glycine betaine/L-proline transporter ProP [Gilliamella sp. B2785]MCX8679491.1 glycine betaine/L-proline transporter ProP [Gilliamella sp. B2865]
MAQSNNKPLDIDDIPIINDNQLKKATWASAFSNAIEWYDFGVYSFVAYIIGQVFFPHVSPSVQIIAALSTFSIPFFVRPLGGIIFGLIGDNIGRQKVLSITLVIMSLSTFCIGLIPTYETIGITSPVLLLIVKLAQGFSIGGEYSGSATVVAEYSPDRKRGFIGGWLDFGSMVGFIIGAGLVVFLSMLLSQSALFSWGWRIPFLIALPLGIISFILHHISEETPTFQQHLEARELQDKAELTLKKVVGKYWQHILICAGLVIVTNVSFYLLLTYMPSYLAHNLNYDTEQGLLIIIAIMVGMLIIQPIIGLLSDKVGRRPFILIGSIGLLLLSYPAFMLINSQQIPLVFLGVFILALFINCFTGIITSILPAMFPTNIRYSAIASIFNVAIIIAGVTPTFVAWLVESTGNLYMPAYNLMLAGFIGVITGLAMHETANKPLHGTNPTAASRDEAQSLLSEHFDSIEEEVEDIDEQIEELQNKRQELVDQHPKLD